MNATAARRADIERRLRPRRTAVFAVLAVGLLASAEWLGWWPLLPLAVAIVGPGVLQKKVAGSKDPGRWEACAWTIGPVMIAVMVAVSGGPRSPAMAAFLLPAVTLAIRFTGRQVWLGVAGLLVLLAASTIARDPAAFAANPPRVLVTATIVLTAILLIGAVTEAERNFRAAATLDPLTGISNRLALASEFELVTAGVRDSGGSVAVLVGDLDGLKEVNDRFGHTAGDQLLRRVANTLERALRPEDRVYRIGGDEFVVVLPGADHAAAEVIAERLSREVAHAPESQTAVAMRFGIAAASGAAVALRDLYETADSRLIDAKRQRNRQRSLLLPLPV